MTDERDTYRRSRKSLSLAFAMIAGFIIFDIQGGLAAFALWMSYASWEDRNNY